MGLCQSWMEWKQVFYYGHAHQHMPAVSLTEECSPSCGESIYLMDLMCVEEALEARSQVKVGGLRTGNILVTLTITKTAQQACSSGKVENSLQITD